MPSSVMGRALPSKPSRMEYKTGHMPSKRQSFAVLHQSQPTRRHHSIANDHGGGEDVWSGDEGVNARAERHARRCKNTCKRSRLTLCCARFTLRACLQGAEMRRDATSCRELLNASCSSFLSSNEYYWLQSVPPVAAPISPQSSCRSSRNNSPLVTAHGEPWRERRAPSLTKSTR
jgi:hypothetical protein